MAIPDVDSVLSSAFGESVMSSFGVAHESLISGVYAEEARRSAVLIESRLSTHQLPTENEAKRKALFDKVTMYGAGRESRIDRNQTDELYSVRLVLSGFLLSFVDSSPSEICTVTVNNVNAAAKWNLLRTADASFLMSIGWLQIDNHCPSAPFPVAFCPSDKENERTQDESDEPDKQMEEAKMTTSPFLVVGVDFAPSHSSGIVVS